MTESFAPRPYGLLAEFESAEALRSAAEQLSAAGFRRIDAFTPFPVEGLSEAVGFPNTRLPLLVLLGGLLGGGLGYAMQWYLTVIEYPLNIGGRPLHSWPSFIPVTFELTILVASLFAVLGMLALNGLPRPHHPLFAIEEFARASTDGYFLVVEATDPQYDDEHVRNLLAAAEATAVWEVPTLG